MNFTKQECLPEESIEKAKQTVSELVNYESFNAAQLFNSDNLEEVEKGIRQLNELSSKCWLVSSLALYCLIYEKNYWQQSGLSWNEYVIAARKRIGLDANTISIQLSCASFFIKYRDKLIANGFDMTQSIHVLARAEFALELCGDIDAVVQHVCNDSVRQFKDWYQSFKLAEIPQVEDKRPDITVSRGSVKINGVKAVTISEEIPQEEKAFIESCLEKIYKSIKAGEVPAIVSVYDETEAKNLIKLRDRNRRGK